MLLRVLGMETAEVTGTAREYFDYLLKVASVE